MDQHTKTRAQSLGRQAIPTPDSCLSISFEPGSRPYVWSEHHGQVSSTNVRIQKHFGREGVLDTANFDSDKYDEQRMAAEQAAKAQMLEQLRAKVMERAQETARQLKQQQDAILTPAQQVQQRLQRVKLFNQRVAAANLKHVKQPSPTFPSSPAGSPSVASGPAPASWVPPDSDRGSSPSLTHLTIQLQTQPAAAGQLDTQAGATDVRLIPGSPAAASDEVGDEQEGWLERSRAAWLPVTRVPSPGAWEDADTSQSDSYSHRSHQSTPGSEVRASGSGSPTTPLPASTQAQRYPQQQQEGSQQQQQQQQEGSQQQQQQQEGSQQQRRPHQQQQQEGGQPLGAEVDLTNSPDVLTQGGDNPRRRTSALVSVTPAPPATATTGLKPHHSPAAHLLPGKSPQEGLTGPPESVQGGPGTTLDFSIPAQYMNDPQSPRTAGGSGSGSAPPPPGLLAPSAIARALLSRHSTAASSAGPGSLQGVTISDVWTVLGSRGQAQGSSPRDVSEAGLLSREGASSWDAADHDHLGGGQCGGSHGESPRLIRVFARPPNGSAPAQAGAPGGGSRPRWQAWPHAVSLDDPPSLTKAMHKMTQMKLEPPPLCSCNSGMSVFSTAYTAKCARNCDLFGRPDLHEALLNQMLHTLGVLA